MKKRKPLFLLFIGLISLTSCFKSKDNSSSSSSHEHEHSSSEGHSEHESESSVLPSSNSEHNSSEHSSSEPTTSEPSSSIPMPDPDGPAEYVVNATEWDYAFSFGYYKNFRQTATQNMERRGDEGITNILGSNKVVVRYDEEKRVINSSASVTIIFEPELLWAKLADEGHTEVYAAELEKTLNIFKLWYGEPTIKDQKYYYTQNEEESEDYAQKYDEDLTYFFTLRHDQTYERYLEHNSFYFDTNVNEVIGDKFSEFTFNKETNKYEAIIEIEDNFFYFFVSFKNGELASVLAEVDYDEELGGLFESGTILIVNDHYGEESVELPADYYECSHEGDPSRHTYLQTEHNHFTECAICGHINAKTIEEHSYINGSCSVCDHYPFLEYEIFIDGYEYSFGFYKVNSLNGATEVVLAYWMNYYGVIDGWQRYLSPNEGVHVLIKESRVFHDDSRCAYIDVKEVKLVEIGSGRTIWEKTTNSQIIRYSHAYQHVEDRKDEHCHVTSLYECPDCGATKVEYKWQDHKLEKISEIDLGSCQTQITEKCSECGEEFVTVYQRAHDFIVLDYNEIAKSGHVQCLICQESFEVDFESVLVDEKAHHYSGYAMTDNGHLYVNITGVHNLDEHGHCIYCGFESSFVKTEILSEYGYLIYGKYVDGELVDFYLHDAELFDTKENYYYKNSGGTAILDIFPVDKKEVYEDDQHYLITTYSVFLDHVLIATIITREVV